MSKLVFILYRPRLIPTNLNTNKKIWLKILKLSTLSPRSIFTLGHLTGYAPNSCTSITHQLKWPLSDHNPSRQVKIIIAVISQFLLLVVVKIIYYLIIFNYLLFLLCATWAFSLANLMPPNRQSNIVKWCKPYK